MLSSVGGTGRKKGGVWVGRGASDLTVPQDPLGRWLKSKFAGPAPKFRFSEVGLGWAPHMHDSEARGPGTTTHRGPGPGTRVPQWTAAS